MNRREERRSRRRKEQMKARMLLMVLLVSLGIFAALLIKGISDGRKSVNQEPARVEQVETGQEETKQQDTKVQETRQAEAGQEEIRGEESQVSSYEKTQDKETNDEPSKQSALEMSKEVLKEKRLQEKVEQKIAGMSLEEKVAQLFMITPEALTGYSTVTAASDVSRQALKQYPVGGLILFSQNIADPKQLSEMTKNLQTYSREISDMPLFLGIDEEGGQVARIGSNNNFDVPHISDMRDIGNTGDTNQAYEAGKKIGEYLDRYGLNLDFAPVADVLTNQENSILQRRSFGTDEKVVADMNIAFLQGLHEKGIYGCLKHFPGHGGTGGDTHKGYAYTSRSRQEIEAVELLPFREGIENGISFIMVSHIGVESLTGDNTPASLSPAVITELLREQMGYEGIVITDAMNMGAITEEYNSAEGAVKAILAGADIVLMPVDFKAAYQGVLDAVANGTISQQRVDESLRRIITVKYKMEG